MSPIEILWMNCEFSQEFSPKAVPIFFYVSHPMDLRPCTRGGPRGQVVLFQKAMQIPLKGSKTAWISHWGQFHFIEGLVTHRIYSQTWLIRPIGPSGILAGLENSRIIHRTCILYKYQPLVL